MAQIKTAVRTSIIDPASEEGKELAAILKDARIKRDLEFAMLQAMKLHVGDRVRYQIEGTWHYGNVIRVNKSSVSVESGMATWTVPSNFVKKIMPGTPAVVAAASEKNAEKYKHYKFHCEVCGRGMDSFDKCQDCGGIPAFA